MKKVLFIILALVLCLSMWACGGQSPKERLTADVKEYISENYRIRVGGYTSEPVNVDIAQVVDVSDNEWAVLGTYTVKVGNEIMSAKFGLVANYDESGDKFIYSKEEFDDFK